MVQPLPPPYEFRFIDKDPYHMCMTDISIDLELNQIISAAALLDSRTSELLHGIHVYDVDLDDGWTHYNRRRAKDAYHPDVKPAVLDLLHEGTRLLLERYKPQQIVCRTEEPTPLGELPARFQETIRFLESQGYKRQFLYQDEEDRWHWECERQELP